MADPDDSGLGVNNIDYLALLKELMRNADGR